MRLDVDLRFDAVPARGRRRRDAEVLDLHTLAEVARSPYEVRRLLRSQWCDEVRVREG